MRGDSDSEAFVLFPVAENIVVVGVEGEGGLEKWRVFVWLAGWLALSPKHFDTSCHK